MLDAHRAENRDADESDRSAALNDNARVEAEYSGRLCALDSVDEHCTGLDQDARIEVEIRNIEYRRAAADEEIVREPAVQMDIVVGEKSVDISSADILLVEVEHRDVGIVLENHAGDDLIADMKRLSGRVDGDVLSHFDDLAGSLVTECDRDETKGIALEFMRIGSADSAALDLDEYVVVAERRYRIFLDLEALLLDENGDMRLIGNSCGLCRRSGAHAGGRRRSFRIVAEHSGEHLFYDFFYIICFVIHSLPH